MANTILLSVVTPERVVFEERVTFFSVKGAAGELGILPNHIPLLTGLRPGLLQYRGEGKEGVIAVAGGFLNVQPTKAIVLADAAERPEEIDLARAKLALERAESQMSTVVHATATAALERATARIRAAEWVSTRSAVLR